MTLIYARWTVLDERDAHSELMAAQTQERADFTAAHGEEMAARQRALASEISVQRLVQAAQVTDVLIAIARAARDETLEPPVPPPAPSEPPSSPPCAHLRAALALFYSLDGPRLAIADELAGKAHSLTTLGRSARTARLAAAAVVLAIPAAIACLPLATAACDVLAPIGTAAAGEPPSVLLNGFDFQNEWWCMMTNTLLPAPVSHTPTSSDVGVMRLAARSRGYCAGERGWPHGSVGIALVSAVGPKGRCHGPYS